MKAKNGDTGSILRDIYNRLRAEGEITLAVDKLPYTQGFNKFYARIPSSIKLTRNEAWCLLINQRKRGACPAPRKRR